MPGRRDRRPAQRLDAWVESRARATYADRHDDLPGDATSRLSPYLHFGCISPLEVARAAAAPPGRRAVPAAALLARLLPPGPRRPPRRRVVRLPARGDRWHDDPDALRARGRTAAPATRSSTPAMRQLAREGLRAQPGPHDRGVVPHQGPLRRLARRRPALPRPAARRRHREQQPQLAVGRRHRHRHQPAPHLQPDRAGQRFDPDGDYVRRYVPELARGQGRRGARPRAQGPPRLRLPRADRRPPRRDRRVQGRTSP